MKVKHILRQRRRIDNGDTKTPMEERQYERGHVVNMGNVSYFVTGNVAQWWLQTFWNPAKREGPVDMDILMRFNKKMNAIRGKI